MKDKITEMVLRGLRDFPPEYWKRYFERVLSTIINTNNANEVLPNVEYHIEQIRSIYPEDIYRRGQEMPDEYDLALRRHGKL